MSNIIVNAPVQNGEFRPDTSLGKVIPLFVANSLREHDATYDEQTESYDLWNNVVAKNQAGLSAAECMSGAEKRLAEKYESQSLQWLLGKRSLTHIYTDTDQGFKTWAE
ncbi:MAG TPA: hypothetical protein VH144_03675, partial [Candidatus Saccharimonadales bacterium]|nr:hypothetical protein [Candidatus Saccharimonadales bacterium]